MEAGLSVLPATRHGQDRAAAVPAAGGYLLAVADGAGGTGSGAIAAERLVELVTQLAAEAASMDWFQALRTFDDDLASRAFGGQTTAVIAIVDSDWVCGVSVGDSCAWLIAPEGEVTDLTARQRRRPLLGSGEALPVQFEAELNGGRLLLASDGLFKYAPVEQICALAIQGTVSEAANALANSVHLPSGGLQDDVAIVVVSKYAGFRFRSCTMEASESKREKER